MVVFQFVAVGGSHRHLDFLAVLDGARGQADIADFLSPILGYIHVYSTAGNR